MFLVGLHAEAEETEEPLEGIEGGLGKVLGRKGPEIVEVVLNGEHEDPAGNFRDERQMCQRTTLLLKRGCIQPPISLRLQEHPEHIFGN